MTRYEFGDILLIRFPFTKGREAKKRPALVLFDAGDDDVIVCRITSQLSQYPYDVFVKEWKEVGLLLPSIIRVHKIATLEKNIVDKKIGQLTPNLKESVKNLFAYMLQ